MFCLNDSMRYWLWSEPTDMRKSFHTLSGIVRDAWGATRSTATSTCSSTATAYAARPGVKPWNIPEPD